MPQIFTFATDSRKFREHFNLSLLIADSGVAAWLLFAHRCFLGLTIPSLTLIITVSITIAGLAWLCGLHRDWTTGGVRFICGAVLFTAFTIILLTLLPGIEYKLALMGLAIWHAVALLIILIFQRAILWKLEEKMPQASLETFRWMIILLVSTWSVGPVYDIKPSGAGDAFWYTIMLADYLEQLRAGIFPVWIGQTEYAFNGAFFPLRLAPGFQHLGGIVDAITIHSLDYVAVKNLVLALSAIATGFFTYFCFRSILTTKPNLAAALALIYLLSPGLLAPWVIGDQYMTFLTGPFVPVVFYGYWRSYTRNDISGHILLGAGTAALWLFHTPVALWTSLFAAGLYVIKIIKHLQSGRECKMMMLALAVYIALGTYPIFSALSIDSMVKFSVDGESIFSESMRIYPDILFKSISNSYGPHNYQPGYAALAAGIAGSALAIYFRNAASLTFAAASLVLTFFLLPIPGISNWLWNHIPQFILNATNTWAAQRLALIWVALLIFTLATAIGSTQKKSQALLTRLVLLILVSASLLWSVREASALHLYIKRTIPVGPSMGWKILYEKHNLILSRYPYSYFQKTPPYFSHAYMDPILENRLLNRTDEKVFQSNYDSAASLSTDQSSVLVSSGLLRAINDNNSVFYLLRPAPTIEPSTHYALRLNFMNEGEAGIFQILGEKLFREYTLPDSGAGMGAQVGPPQSFGTTSTSSHVVPLYTNAINSVPIQITQILPDRPKTAEFDCANYQLWKYDPKKLPIIIHSLAPYRAQVHSPKATYLETPRMWLSGYSALVNGERLSVLRSPSNLCMIPLEAGESSVELNYNPPFYVRATYWIAITGWGMLVIIFLLKLFIRKNPIGSTG